MGLFKRKRETREEQKEETINETSIDDPLLRALLGKDNIDRETVQNIPSVSACINKIADTVSSLQIKLYKRSGDRVEEVTGDNRIRLLNEETGDTLDGCQFKKAMVTDMYLGRGGYAFVNKIGETVKSIHYVEEQKIGFMYNTDPIFKDYQIEVNGTYYEGWQFIKLLRNTRNGFCGKSIVEENGTLLSIIYASQLYEKNLVKTGGNKKGFIKSQTRLTREAMTALKNAFRNLYSNSNENVVVLNDGLDFKESSNTSVEMQMNENKTTNSNDICKIFLVPPPIINGNPTEEDKKQYIEGCIIPILDRFASAINAVMLSEAEKDTMLFAFDTTDLLKGDVEKRFNAYKVALDSGFMQLDEVRKSEKLPVFGLDFIKLGLQDVLYYPKENQIYTPNTNKLSSVGEEAKEEQGKNENVAPVQLQEGGEENED